MREHYWIISFDNLAGDDHDDFCQLPNFRRYLEKAAWNRHVYSVYPSVTYPAHTTIVTGRYPSHHGVTNNTLFQPGRLGREDWNWTSRRIHGETLFDLVHKKGMKQAAYLWPVTGSNRKIDYNMPEIFANRRWDSQVFTSLRHGSRLFQLQVFLKYGKELDGTRQPALDNFLHHVIQETVRTRDPEVQFIHFTDLDTTRHIYGHGSQEAAEALKRHDRRLGDILDMAEQQEKEGPVHLIVLGDHSSLDEHAAIYLNVLFRQKEWLRLKEDGSVRSFRAICHTADGSAYIHIPDPEDIPYVAGMLKVFSLQHDNCIEKIYTGRQAAAFGAGACNLMVEARRGYYFLDEADGEETVHEIRPEDVEHMPHITRSTHGYSPFKRDYQTFFSMMGPDICPGEIAEPMRLVDVGPTIAHLMGGKLADADGRVQLSFFR